MYEFSETPRHSDEKREKTKLMSLDEFSHILRQERCKRGKKRKTRVKRLDPETILLPT